MGLELKIVAFVSRHNVKGRDLSNTEQEIITLSGVGDAHICGSTMIQIPSLSRGRPSLEDYNILLSELKGPLREAPEVGSLISDLLNQGYIPILGVDSYYIPPKKTIRGFFNDLDSRRNFIVILDNQIETYTIYAFLDTRKSAQFKESLPDQNNLELIDWVTVNKDYIGLKEIDRRILKAGGVVEEYGNILGDKSYTNLLIHGIVNNLGSLEEEIIITASEEYSPPKTEAILEEQSPDNEETEMPIGWQSCNLEDPEGVQGEEDSKVPPIVLGKIRPTDGIDERGVLTPEGFRARHRWDKANPKEAEKAKKIRRLKIR